MGRSNTLLYSLVTAWRRVVRIVIVLGTKKIHVGRKTRVIQKEIAFLKILGDDGNVAFRCVYM